MIKSQLFISEIAQLIRKLCADAISKNELNRLSLMSGYIVSDRRGNLSRRLHAAAKAEGCTKDNIILSLLGHPFSEKYRRKYWEKAIGSALEQSDSDLFRRFEWIICNEADQELTHRRGDNDPVGARLHHNLCQTLREDKRFHRFPEISPRWVVLSGLSDLREDLPSCGIEELERVVYQTKTDEESLGNVVESVLREVSAMDNCSPVVDIEDLSHALISYFRGRKVDIKEWIPAPALNPHLKVLTDRACLQVLEETDRFLDGWLSKGLVSNQLAKVSRDGVRDLLGELAIDGATSRYWQYLEPYIVGKMNGKIYRADFRQFDILASNARNRFHELMRECYKE